MCPVYNYHQFELILSNRTRDNDAVSVTAAVIILSAALIMVRPVP